MNPLCDKLEGLAKALNAWADEMRRSNADAVVHPVALVELLGSMGDVMKDLCDLPPATC